MFYSYFNNNSVGRPQQVIMQQMSTLGTWNLKKGIHVCSEGLDAPYGSTHLNNQSFVLENKV